MVRTSSAERIGGNNDTPQQVWMSKREKGRGLTLRIQHSTKCARDACSGAAEVEFEAVGGDEGHEGRRGDGGWYRSAIGERVVTWHCFQGGVCACEPRGEKIGCFDA